VPQLERLCAELADSHIVLVAAAGNDGDRSVDYPAAYDACIAVAAYDKNHQRAWFSDMGGVDIAAPGVDILSAVTGGNYAEFSGTSMAAPHVAASICLRHQAEDLPRRSTHADACRRLFERVCIDMGAPGHDAEYGAGRIDYDLLLDTQAPAARQWRTTWPDIPGLEVLSDRKPIDADHLRTLIEVRKLTFRQAAAALGCSSFLVHKLVHRWSIVAPTRPPISADERQAIEADILAARYGVCELARRYKRSKSTMSVLRKKLLALDDGRKRLPRPQRCHKCGGNITETPCRLCLPILDE
jgi:hypothetical protein